MSFSVYHRSVLIFDFRLSRDILLCWNLSDGGVFGAVSFLG